ncbi:uncharacterized protein BKA78DRAFT_306545 [Phyllosticta capitalensis]|uniref:uncharacterized protein n=1 Tax=Phyllosticta capitalensis TaxID=121624 RepID=UPI00312DE74A
MAHEPRDLVMRKAPDSAANHDVRPSHSDAVVGFTAVNSRPSRAQSANDSPVAPPGHESFFKTSPEMNAPQDLPPTHGLASAAKMDPTPPNDPHLRTNSPSPYKRPTDFRIIPYTPPAEKKRKRLATDDPDDGSERFSPERQACAATEEQDYDSASDLESDDNSPEADMRPSEEQDSGSNKLALDHHRSQKQTHVQAQADKSTADDQKERHGSKQSERTDSACDNAGAIANIIERPRESHGPARKDAAPSSQLTSENPGIAEITKAGVQIDPQKKRKRNFSNRTKTGCQTCRRRKKKCDENKPVCFNCSRGGFVCEGYLTTSWPKSGMPKTTPIQSKQSFSESPRIFPRPIGDQASENRSTIRTEESQPRLPSISEDSSCDFRGQWGPVREDQPRRTYSQDRSAGPDVPSIMARAPSDPYRRMIVGESGQHEQQAPWIPTQRPEQLPKHTSLPHEAVGPAPAPLNSVGIFRSVQLTPLAGGSRHDQLPFPQENVAQMLGQFPYYRNEPLLVESRKRCKALLQKYNFALMAGLRDDDDLQLLREVIVPSEGIKSEQPFRVGQIARDVRVEGPFTCDYGWNIVLHEKVTVGPNCSFEDGAKIEIGPRTVIGPDVKIYTSDPHNWPARKEGDEVPTISRNITIDEDVFIGGNSTILSGIHIKKGTVVAAGSVLSRRMFPPDGVGEAYP